MTDKVSSLLPAVAEVTRHRHYHQHISLLETLLHRLPHIARGLGKRTFKRHLELFLDGIFYGAVSSSCVHCMTVCIHVHVHLWIINPWRLQYPFPSEVQSSHSLSLPPSSPPTLLCSPPFSLPLPPLSLSQTSDTALVKAAAEDCLIQLSQHLGHHILRGRVDQHCPQ